MNTCRRKIVVFCANYPPAFRGGGPIRTLSALVRKAPPEFEVSVVTSDTDLGEQRPLDVTSGTWVEQDDARVFYGRVRSWPGTWSALVAARTCSPDVIYLNSFFDLRYSIVPQVLASVGFFGRVRTVIAPRGEFGSRALALKSQKKRIFTVVHGLLGLRRRVTWHASSEREQRDIRAVVGNSADIVVREDDTDLPALPSAPPERPAGPLRAVYVGRIVRIKGVADLLASLAHVPYPLEFDVIGPEEDATYAARCRALMDHLPPHVRVRFRGQIEHGSVRTILGSYDVMLFPTRGENFGHVVAEALSVSCPVVCADTTPWTSWIRQGGGTVVEPDDTVGWSRAVAEWAQLSRPELLTRRGRAGEVYARWSAESFAGRHLFTQIIE